jgi:hypothetical protein
MGLRKKFRNWCPQPPTSLPSKLKRHSVPIAAVFSIALIFSVSFAIYTMQVMSHPIMVPVSIANVVATQNGTEVRGTITQDTIWTPAGNPYTIIGTVVVNNDVTLTIQPGVIVNLGLNDLQINGTLNAQGTNSDNIIFHAEESTSGRITFGSITSDSPNCTITNAQIDTAYIWSYNTIELTNNTLDRSHIQIMGGNAKIAGNNLINTAIIGSYALSDGLSIISGNTMVATADSNIVSGVGISGGSAVISHNTLDMGNSTIIFQAISATTDGTAVINDNTIYNCRGGIVAGRGTSEIQRNLVTNCQFGVQVFAASPAIENNTITQNGLGINIVNSTLPANPQIMGNNIYDNSISNLYLGAHSDYNPDIKPVAQSTSNSINAASNWWGTTDATAINQTIHDAKNNPLVGTVTFTPFLDTPNSHAEPDPNAPIPSLRSPSPSPFLPISSNTQIIVIGALAAVIIIAIAGILLLKRKQK